jgi:hypothetical protein
MVLRLIFMLCALITPLQALASARTATLISGQKIVIFNHTDIAVLPGISRCNEQVFLLKNGYKPLPNGSYSLKDGTIFDVYKNCFKPRAIQP